MEPILIRNNSQSPRCMRALPASQSCHVRSVDPMSAAAAVWDSPASSRACRISAEVGLFAVTAGDDVVDCVKQYHRICAFVVRDASEIVPLDYEVCAVPVYVSQCGFGKHSFDFRNSSSGDFVSNLNSCHDQVPFVFELRRSTHELNYARNPCNCKNYFSGQKTSPLTEIVVQTFSALFRYPIQY